MTPTLLPAGSDLSKVTINAFYNKGGELPERYVVPLQSLDSVDASSLVGSVGVAYQGSTFTGFASAVAITAGQVVFMNGSSQWNLADANGSSTFPARGIVVGEDADGKDIVLREGLAYNSAWNWTPGGTLYLSNTAGGLTQTAPTGPSNLQAVGFALSADSAFFDFGSDVTAIA
jgi:hypothetical protein